MRILLLDGLSQLEALAAELRSRSYGITACQSWQEARYVLSTSPIDVALLDASTLSWQLPAVCRELRRTDQQVGLMILDNASSSSERAVILEAGADDYLSSPYELTEALARVRALGRRVSAAPRRRAGQLTLLEREHAVSVSGERVELTPREFALLRYFIDHADETLTRSELLSEIWGTSSGRASNVIDVHIARLREKLGPTGNAISCIRGVGYRFSSAGPKPRLPVQLAPLVRRAG